MNRYFVLVCVFCALGVGALARAGEATVAWKAPTTCADGSALTNCPTIGFNIDIQKDGGTFSPLITASPTATSYTALNLTPGSYVFRMATVTLNGVTSVSVTGDKPKVIPVSTPNPPSAVTVN